MTTEEELKIYRGNCHCKAYVFEVRLPEIKQVDRCNCSVCYKKGALWAFPQPANLRWVTGDANNLTNYSFGKGNFGHKHCPTCGTSLQCLGRSVENAHGEPEYGLNVRAIQGLDIWSLETRLYDGAAIPPPYQPPQFVGTVPQAELEGGKIFYGSCHCGAVRLAVKSSPLDETYDDHVIECNCSICGRYGAIWIHPKNEFVVVDGEENLSSYDMGLGLFNKTFCKICGVPVDNKVAVISAAQEAALPEARRFLYNRGKVLRGVNLKVLNGVDLEPLKTERLDGWNKVQPQYENP